MKEPKIIAYKNKSIYYMDFSDLKDEKIIKQIIDKSAEFIRSQPERSVLSLTNLQGMHFNSTIKELFSKFITGNKPFIKASAVVGISGLQRIIYNGVMRITGRNIRSFDNINVAKDWLTSQ